MATTAQLRYSSLSKHHRFAGSRRFSEEASRFPSISLPLHSSTFPPNISLSSLHPRVAKPDSAVKLELSGDGGIGCGGIGRGTGGGDKEGWSSGGSKDSDSSDPGTGILGLLLNGWRSRVAADPEFPFKVLMEELVGVSACGLGDMASRPNFGLNELDLVFSTLVVGVILNFVLMYLLAPTLSSSSSSNLPAIFANCPKSHIFESGAYSFVDRLGTFVYKGTIFAVVGFGAGLAGTVITNELIKMRKKVDPNFEMPKSPPTLLNALTWAIHMGLSCNIRYQTLNGIEFFLAKMLPPLAFKSSVVGLRALNNVLGGVSFVALARLTGSQKIESGKTMVAMPATGSVGEKLKLLGSDEDLQSSQSTYK